MVLSYLTRLHRQVFDQLHPYIANIVCDIIVDVLIPLNYRINILEIYLFCEYFMCQASLSRYLMHYIIEFELHIV